MALTRKATGSVEGFYYNDVVMLEVNDYNEALAVLELLETMSLKQYKDVFLGGGGAKNKRDGTTGKRCRSGEPTND